MAIQRVTGQMLESNLTRGGFDLAFETDLLYLDVINGRIGVKTDAPGNYALDVAGNTRITGDLTVQGTTTTVDSQNLTVEDNLIVINSSGSVGHNSGVMINRGAEGNNATMIWDESEDKFKFGTTTSDGSTTADFAVSLSNIQVATPVAGDDAATKAYVDSQVSGGVGAVTGDNVQLNLPSDSTFGDGAYLGLTASTSVTQAIDDLNETIDNVRAGTYLKSVTFTADSTSISAGDTVTLTITTVPTAGANTRYTITWGDGDTTTGTSDSTPSHTYASGGTFSVTVKAFENDAATTDSSGSFATSTRTGYITVATTEPEVAFAIYAAASGGSPITTADNGSTVYLQNNTTETSGATVTYDIDWGDGSEDAIGSDGEAGGAITNGGSRIAHTYTNSVGDDGSTVAGTGAGDTKYQIRLRLLTHSTANPAVIPKQTTNNFEVYSTHTVEYSAADSTIRGVNEEATSGFPVTFTNDTATNPGSNSDFSATQRYTWNFGEGDANTLVNVGSGSPGDTGQTITNTFNLSSGEQSAGTTQTYTTSLSLANGHSTQPFSANLNIIVEPDVRANIAGTAVTVSTGSSDNQYTLYDHTDLDSNVRSLARFTNTSQNADDYVYDYYDDSSSLVTVSEDGASAGSIAATIDKDYTGASNGNINFRFRASGQPDTIFQDDEETLTFVMKAVPSAPAGLSSKSITLADAAQGTNPHLCAGFDDNTGAATTLSAGDSLETTVARRYTTTTTIDTSTASNFYDGSTGTLAAEINASDDGTKAFTSAENETGTFTSLVVSSNVDYDTVDSSYPQRFYLVASAKITKNLSAYVVGVNAQRLTHTTTGDTNYVHVVKDDITATPTTAIGTVTESSAGSYRYISGVPYYNTGSPTLQVAGTTVANFTGQAYQDTSSPHEVDPGTNQESTSGNVIANNNYTYANIDGASSMLTGGIPNTDTGVSSAYTLGNISVPITTSGVRSIQTIKARSKNANGTGSYSEDTTKIQVYTASLLTLDDEAGGITVSDSLGATFDDDAVRISGLGSLSGDTPSLFDSSNANYYTDHAWSGAVTVAGTNEAIARFGTIKHFTTDLSSGYLPAGPDLATGRSGAQYFTFAFRRTTMANFTVRLSGKVSGCFIAAPGTAIDSASTLNGWLDASITYGGSGVPGADTGNGGNGSNGCAFTSGDRIIDNTTYSNQTFTLTLGSENATNATGNNVLVRFKLESGDSITALSIE
jgi:plastocyanin